MRILLAAALALGTTIVPAFPQGEYGRNKRLDDLYEAQQKEKLRIEKEYENTMKRLRSNDGSKTQNDPWRDVRPIDNSPKR